MQLSCYNDDQRARGSVPGDGRRYDQRVEQPDPARLAAWRTFLEAHARVTDALQQELEAEKGLALTWYDVLVQLERAPGRRLRMSELAGAVLLSKSGLTRLVDRMANEGLVERCADPADRRATFVSLSPAGLDRLRDAAPVHLRGIQEHFAAHMAPAEAVRIRAVLERMVAALASDAPEA
jgi:DNA-binding MarR family transcriptional regulator